MNITEKEHLALQGDMSNRAAAIRIKAARLVCGFGLEALASEVDQGMTKQKISNAESGSNLPPLLLMRYFHRHHDIDFNFLIHGDFSRLHQSVQERLFPALVTAHSEWDQKRGSDQHQEASPTSQRKVNKQT